MAMTWWMWVVVAAGLAVIELSGPGFFVIFFAAGALVTGLALALVPELGLWAQLAIFSVSSVLSLLVFRRRLASAFPPGAGKPEELVKETATALEDIAPGAYGKAELRGSPWKAHNSGAGALSKGQRCKVTAVDGLTIHIQAD